MPKGKQLTEAEKAARETAKAEKFKELAQKRVNDAMDAIARIAPLANRNNYNYTEEQVNKIGEALKSEVTRLGERFANPSAKDETKFAL